LPANDSRLAQLSSFGPLTENPFFPVGNGEAIARAIPGARLLVLEDAATAIPDAAAGEVAEAMLTLR